MLPACRVAFTLLALLAFNASGSAQQSQQVFPLPDRRLPARRGTRSGRQSLVLGAAQWRARHLRPGDRPEP